MNPWIALGLVLAWLASLSGVGYWQNDAGHTAERVSWQAKDIKQLSLDNQAAHDAEEKYRSIEHDSAVAIEKISSEYQKELKYEKQKTSNLVADARSGAYRMRDLGTTACPPSGNNLPETTTSSIGRDGQEGAGFLSTDATVFLTEEASRADEIVLQLTACQSIVESDRR